MSEAKERKGIQSIERAFALLEQIAARKEGASLSELSVAVGLHNSTTYHLLKTMTALSYVRQSKDTKRYRIGSRMFKLAAGALDETQLVSIVAPYLKDLTAETGDTSLFAIRMGDDTVVIAKAESPGIFQLSEHVSGVKPGYCTALGKVMLAALTPSQVDNYVATHKLAPQTPSTITDPDTLRTELDDVRAEGIAFDNGEYHAEIRCIAVPVRDFTNQVVGALGVSGPMWHFSLRAIDAKRKALKNVAARLSGDLGYSDPDIDVRNNTAGVEPSNVASSVS